MIGTALYTYLTTRNQKKDTFYDGNGSTTTTTTNDTGTSTSTSTNSNSNSNNNSNTNTASISFNDSGSGIRRTNGNRNNNNNNNNNNNSDSGSGFGKAVGGLLLLIVLLFIVELGLCSWASYLSWTSNTLVGWGTPAKVIFAICAFMSGVSYLVTHLVNKLDLIRALRRTLVAPGAMPFASNSASRQSNSWRNAAAQPQAQAMQPQPNAGRL